MEYQQAQHQKKAAMFFVAAFGIAILAISGVTTFSFFSTYFSAIFPQEMLGAELASMMAGGAGVLLFDIAAIYWLYTFLNHAETPEQRGIALIMLVITFIGAAGASIAQLGLAASGDVALDPSTRQSIANASVWTVIIGVVANFGANIAYSRYSLASKSAVMEADRRDMVQQAENDQARHLDSLIAQNVKELITEQAPALAQEQARRVVASFRNREMAKYAGVDSSSTDGDYLIEHHYDGKVQIIAREKTYDAAVRRLHQQPHEGIYKITTPEGGLLYSTAKANPARPTPAPQPIRAQANGNGYHPE